MRRLGSTLYTGPMSILAGSLLMIAACSSAPACSPSTKGQVVAVTLATEPARGSAAALPKTHLEGLVPHENVAVQREAELASLEESAVSLRVLAVCARGMQWGHMLAWSSNRSTQLSVLQDTPLP